MRRAQYVELKRRWSNMGSLGWTEGRAPFWQTVLLFTELVWNPTCLMCLAYVCLIAILASVQNLYDRCLRMFVWLVLAFVCMIAACVVVSTIRISRFQMQTGFDWSFPSIHQDIRIILVFRSGLVTFLLKCGEYCGGHHVQCSSMSFEVWWWLWWTPSSSFSFKVLWRLWLSCSDICQPGLYEGLSPESNSIRDWCWIWWGIYMGLPHSGFWLLLDSGKCVGACKQWQRCLYFYLAFFFGSCVTLYR